MKTKHDHNPAISQKSPDDNLRNSNGVNLGFNMYAPNTLIFSPGMAVADKESISRIGPNGKLLENKGGRLKFLVGINVADCEDMMGNDHDWALAPIAGPRIALQKNQVFIPILYFRNCMVGVSIDNSPKKDPIVQKWFMELDKVRAEGAIPQNHVDGNSPK